MDRYETATPKAPALVAALFLTLATLGILVIAPASLDAGGTTVLATRAAPTPAATTVPSGSEGSQGVILARATAPAR